MNRKEISAGVLEGEYDAQYATYIMENSKGDLAIGNGDSLLEAMEAGYMMDEFIDFLCATNGLE